MITSGAWQVGKDDFIYDQRCDSYRCPASEAIIYRHTSIESGMAIRVYWASSRGTFG